MRYLHRVQMHEKFVASGTYQTPTRLLKDREHKTIEHWSIHEQPGGTRLVRIDIEDQAHVMLLEAWINLTDDGRVVERLDLFGRSKSEKAVIKTVKSTYNFFDDHIQIGRTINDTERYHGEYSIVLRPYIGTYTGSFLLTGYTVAQVAHTAVPHTVASPEIDFLYENSFVFEQGVDWVDVKLIGEEDLTVGSKLYETKKLEVHWQENMPMAIAYLDANDVLLKYEHLQHPSMWQFDLLNYARRPT
jgi:hypothetical protein